MGTAGGRGLLAAEWNQGEGERQGQAARCSGQGSPGLQSSGDVTGRSIESVMIGRQAYNDPWGILSDADRGVFGEQSNPCISRRQVCLRR